MAEGVTDAPLTEPPLDLLGLPSELFVLAASLLGLPDFVALRATSKSVRARLNAADAWAELTYARWRLLQTPFEGRPPSHSPHIETIARLRPGRAVPPAPDGAFGAQLILPRALPSATLADVVARLISWPTIMRAMRPHASLGVRVNESAGRVLFVRHVPEVVAFPAPSSRRSSGSATKSPPRSARPKAVVMSIISKTLKTTLEF